MDPRTSPYHNQPPIYPTGYVCDPNDPQPQPTIPQAEQGTSTQAAPYTMYPHPIPPNARHDVQIPTESGSITNPGISRRRSSQTRPKKELQCTGCPATFERLSALKQHILSHTGEKPHACEACRRRFSIASNLRRHMRTCPVIKERLALGIRPGPSDALTTASANDLHRQPSWDPHPTTEGSTSPDEYDDNDLRDGSNPPSDSQPPDSPFPTPNIALEHAMPGDDIYHQRRGLPTSFGHPHTGFMRPYHPPERQPSYPPANVPSNPRQPPPPQSLPYPTSPPGPDTFSPVRLPQGRVSAIGQPRTPTESVRPPNMSPGDPAPLPLSPLAEQPFSHYGTSPPALGHQMEHTPHYLPSGAVLPGAPPRYPPLPNPNAPIVYSPPTTTRRYDMQYSYGTMEGRPLIHPPVESPVQPEIWPYPSERGDEPQDTPSWSGSNAYTTQPHPADPQWNQSLQTSHPPARAPHRSAE
ncbi:hypothetical protein FRB99_000535 [Tulasnella sp. 403]|nr:hypothetical protein FRB99_000535 [Tulasnella sp. 403]